MKKAKFAPYPCHCGGKLMEAPIHVEHLGIEFGVRTGHVCTRCGDEFLTEETWQEIEDAAKKAGFFGLERKVRVRRSGNSLVVAIPRDLARFLGVDKDSLVSLLPLGKGRLEVQILG